MKQSEQVTAMMEAALELQKLIYHLPADLGINEFKRVARSTSLSKSAQNKLIKAYKKRSWMEFGGVTRGRGTFPVHSAYGRKVKIMHAPIFIHDIEVKHGKQ